MIAFIALIVFIVSWAQTTVLMALIMALAATIVSGFLLTLLLGTGWITQPRSLPRGNAAASLTPVPDSSSQVSSNP
jgi:hypothetical protein